MTCLSVGTRARPAVSSQSSSESTKWGLSLSTPSPTSSHHLPFCLLGFLIPKSKHKIHLYQENEFQKSAVSGVRISSSVCSLCHGPRLSHPALHSLERSLQVVTVTFIHSIGAGTHTRNDHSIKGLGYFVLFPNILQGEFKDSIEMYTLK